MSDLATTIDTYIEAYSEADAARRADLISRVWAPDGALVDPPLDAIGHDGISNMAATVQEHYPGHRFRRTSGIDAHHGYARYGWELVAPDGSVALTGLDIAEVCDNGRLRRVVGFLGELPADDA